MEAKWTEEEIEILKEYAPKCHYKQLVKVLPNRSINAINLRAHMLGIELITDYYKLNEETGKYIKENWGKMSIRDLARNLKVTPKIIYRYKKELNLPDIKNKLTWDKEKIELLRKLSKEMTIDELAKKFKTTKGTISTIAYNEDIVLINSSEVWTKEKIETLRELAQHYTVEEIVNIINMSPNSIRSCAKRNNIKLIQNKKQNNIWTEKNDSELISLVNQGKTLIEIVIRMDKKEEIIIKKSKELGLNITINEEIWTEEEIEKLITLSKTMKIEELVKKLKHTSSSIKKQAKKNNIKVITDRKMWTLEEEQLLEKLILIDKKTTREIADILNRTEDAVILKMKKKGLKNLNGKRVWTTEEERLLCDLWGNTSIEIISKKLNRTPSSITNKVFQLGLGSSIQNNYEGLTIKQICEIFNVSRRVVEELWIVLGLKYKIKRISQKSSYMYVEIAELFNFLEANQNIWDSRNLEVDILGKEPAWLKEKRKSDINKPEIIELELMKQSLILAGKYYLKEENIEEQGFQKIIEIKNIKT